MRPWGWVGGEGWDIEPCASGSGVLGNELGGGSGLTPRVVGSPGMVNRRNRAEKLNRLCMPGWPGTATALLRSIGLFTIDDGAGPPMIVAGDTDWARTGPATQ